MRKIPGLTAAVAAVCMAGAVLAGPAATATAEPKPPKCTSKQYFNERSGCVPRKKEGQTATDESQCEQGLSLVRSRGLAVCKKVD